MKTRFPIIAVVCLVAAIALGVIALLNLNHSSPAAAAAATVLPNPMPEMSYLPSPQELGLALHRAGLEPESLAAAGVSDNAVSTMVQNVRQYLSENPNALDMADDAFGQARHVVDNLRRQIQSGQASQEELNALAAAQSTLSSAEATRNSAINAIFNAGAGNLTEQQRTSLTTIAMNRHWELPVQFLLVHRPQSEWVALRDALANQRIAAAGSVSPDPAAAALIQQAQSHPAVSSAVASLSSNLAAIEVQWSSAVAQP